MKTRSWWTKIRKVLLDCLDLPGEGSSSASDQIATLRSSIGTSARLNPAQHVVQVKDQKQAIGHSVDFEGFDPADFRGVRDQICTTYGPKLNCARQVDF